MSIVNSTFVVGVVQKDGRVYVIEIHVDNVGLQYVIEYLSDAGADFASIMTARASLIADQLVADELTRVLSIDGPPVLQYSTLGQLATILRNKYKDLSSFELARVARWIVNRITEGTFTDTQVRNAFGLTLNQYNTLKAKWVNWKAEYEDISSATGE